MVSERVRRAWRARPRTAQRLGATPALLATFLFLVAQPVRGSETAPGRPGASASNVRPPVAGRTRADLDEARRRVDRLEAEAALTAARKPYAVLDLERRSLLIRLMGMTVRDIPLRDAEARGLVASPRGGPAPAAFARAAIFTLREKDKDPRLSPLTPEQIEAGLDDENAADALPPEPPTGYALRFKQPVVVTIDGRSGPAAIGGLASGLRALWEGLRGSGSGGTGETVVRIGLRVDETAARELYRNFIPGERWLIVPPAGLMLPGAGQELPRTIRPPRPSPQPTPPKTAPPGVPFQIPPPVENETPPPAVSQTPGSEGPILDGPPAGGPPVAPGETREGGPPRPEPSPPADGAPPS